MKFEIGDRVRPTGYKGSAGIVFSVRDSGDRQIVSYQCFDRSQHSVTADQIRLDTEADPPVILIDKIKKVLNSYPEIVAAFDLSDDKNIPDIITDLAEFAVINERFENDE